jgi:hypothetical protein
MLISKSEILKKFESPITKFKILSPFSFKDEKYKRSCRLDHLALAFLICLKLNA